MYKKILLIVIMCIMITACKKEEEVKNDIIKYDGGSIKIEFKDYEGYEDKIIEITDSSEIEDILNNFNYADEKEINYRGPASITYYYINESNEEYSFKIWEEGVFEFAKLNIECPDRNCSKGYEITNGTKLITYALEKYNKK